MSGCVDVWMRGCRACCCCYCRSGSLRTTVVARGMSWSALLEPMGLRCQMAKFIKYRYKTVFKKTWPFQNPFQNHVLENINKIRILNLQFCFRYAGLRILCVGCAGAGFESYFSFSWLCFLFRIVDLAFKFNINMV